MKNLEDAIRDLVSRGELTHFSIAPRVNGKFKGWAASVSPATGFGNAYAEDPDPIKAALDAIEQIKARRPRAKSEPAAAAPTPAKAAAPEVDLSDILG